MAESDLKTNKKFLTLILTSIFNPDVRVTAEYHKELEEGFHNEDFRRNSEDSEVGREQQKQQ
jgi:hypothetical protein